MRFVRQIAFVALAPLLTWGAEESAADDAETSVRDSPAFDRYRTIIDRMPFGVPPPNFDPTLPPGSAAAAAAAAAAANGEMTEEQRTEEQQKLAATVRVSVLNVTPAGRTMVGFTDSSAQPPEHYYLPVGGEKNGWLVKAAEPAEEKITLVKGELEVTVKLGEGPTGDGKDGKRKAPLRGLAAISQRGGLLRQQPQANGGEQGTAAAPSAPMPLGGGAMARLRERRARQMQEQQAEAARRAEAVAEEKAEREQRAAEAKAAAEQAAAEREQQRAALLQIQDELRRQREEKERQKAEQEQNGESSE